MGSLILSEAELVAALFNEGGIQLRACGPGGQRIGERWRGFNGGRVGVSPSVAPQCGEMIPLWHSRPRLCSTERKIVGRFPPSAEDTAEGGCATWQSAWGPGSGETGFRADRPRRHEGRGAHADTAPRPQLINESLHAATVADEGSRRGRILVLQRNNLTNVPFGSKSGAFWNICAICCDTMAYGGRFAG